MASQLLVRTSSIQKVGLAAAQALFLLSGVTVTQAADTVEPWDVGQRDALGWIRGHYCDVAHGRG